MHAPAGSNWYVFVFLHDHHVVPSCVQVVFQLPTGMHSQAISSRKWFKGNVTGFTHILYSLQLVTKIKTMLSFNFNSSQSIDTEEQGESTTLQQGMTNPNLRRVEP